MAKKCSYTKKYRDPDSEMEVSYKCVENENNEVLGLCKFHDKGYASDKEKKREIIGLLKKRVEAANELLEKKATTARVGAEPTLDWTGYQIPEIEIDDNFEFEVDVLFNFVNFIGDVHFEEAAFKRKARFCGATFSGEAHFEEAKFEGETSFSNATFVGEASFRDAEFKGLTS